MPKEDKGMLANSTIDQGCDAAEGPRTQPAAVEMEGREMNVRMIWKVGRMSFMADYILSLGGRRVFLHF